MNTRIDEKFRKSIVSIIGKSWPLFLGLIAAVWFLIRVIPKPSRAFYPCQRVAFPIASTFVIWLLGLVASINVFSTVRQRYINKQWGAVILTFLTGCFFILTINLLPQFKAYAGANTSAEALFVSNQNGIQTDVIDSLLATVSIVESDKDSTYKIEYPEVEEMIRKAVEQAGGLEYLISDSMTVILKPNLIGSYEWGRSKRLPPGSNGMVTDYRVIQAVVNIVRELNPNGNIYVMEGSGIGATMENMEKLGWDQVSGADSIMAIEEVSGDWAEFESDKLVSVTLPDSVRLYQDRYKPNKTKEFYFNKLYYEADVLISLPVLKNHSMSGITGGVKNVGVGASPANIYGNGPNHGFPIQRMEGINHSTLSEWIHDYYLCKPVDFTIVDGLQGTDFGPVGQQSRGLSSIKKNMRLILAGKNAVSVDAISSLIMGYDPVKIGHLVFLNNSGAGVNTPILIDVVGPKVEEIRKDFTQMDPPGGKIRRYEAGDYMPDSIKYEPGKIQIFMSDTSYLAGIRFKIDSSEIKGIRVRNYQCIELDVSDIEISDSLLSIHFTDRYLNTLEKQIKGNYALPTEPDITSFNFYLNQQADFSIYPNPVSDHCNIEFYSHVYGSYKIRIYNSSGHILYEETLNKQEFASKIQIDSGFLPSGSYFISLQNGNLKGTKRFIKL